MKFEKNFLSYKVLLVGSFIFIIFLCSVFLGISIGPSDINIVDILAQFFHLREMDRFSAIIIWNIRLPRVLMAALVGAALSLGGLVLQVLLRNFLAEPYILGVSGGSAVGAILGILLGLSRFPGVTISAFLGSMISVVLLLWFILYRTLFNKESLLLIGVMINAFCSAIIMFLISVIHDSRLHSILFWLMGDLSVSTLDGMGVLVTVLMICFAIITVCSNKMNLLQLGDDMAQSMGVNVKNTGILLLVCVSIMVSITVSYCGLIGFVGLVVSHVLRLVLTTDCRLLVPACIVAGSTYVILCDIIARVLLNHGELPTGVITALIGAPIFVYLLLKRARF